MVYNYNAFSVLVQYFLFQFCKIILKVVSVDLNKSESYTKRASYVPQNSHFVKIYNFYRIYFANLFN